MKTKRISIFIPLLIITALCFGLGYIYANSLNDYNPNAYPKNGLSDFDLENIGHYKIDPEMILPSLDRGKTNVFDPELATPSAPVFNKVFSWHQSDYLKITDAVFQSVWGDTINDWSLLSMVFDTTCRDNPDGFESGDIHFFKENGESTYATREILITPLYGDVSWGWGRSFPRPSSGWKSIDLRQLKITADDAFTIAEENGGNLFRLGRDNNCSIGMILNIESYDRWRNIGVYSWRIEYYENVSYASFGMQIDPYTGTIIDSKTFIPTSNPSP